VFDTSQEKIIDHIDLTTDIAQQIVVSPDKKKLYGYTVRTTPSSPSTSPRENDQRVPLNEANRNVRLLGLAPDPSGKFLYSRGPFPSSATRSL